MKQLKGFILTYNSSKKKDITKINHFLFGRVCTVKNSSGEKEKYYYPGFFENTPYKKLSNGCYFVQEVNYDLGGLLKLHACEIIFDDDTMLMARDFWSSKISGKVNNW